MQVLAWSGENAGKIDSQPASGNDAVIVRVINLLALPLRVPSRLKQSLAWTADALARAERRITSWLILKTVARSKSAGP